MKAVNSSTAATPVTGQSRVEITQLPSVALMYPALSQPSIFDGAPEGLFATRGAASLPELHGSPKKGGRGA